VGCTLSILTPRAFHMAPLDGQRRSAQIPSPFARMSCRILPAFDPTRPPGPFGSGNPRVGSSLKTTLLAFTLLCGVSCDFRGDATTSEEPHRSMRDPLEVVEFDLHWPLLDPSEKLEQASQPLPTGTVCPFAERLETSGTRMIVRFSLQRSQNEDARQFWNSRLVYPEYRWMRHVRVWDTEEQWLYPNLPYLFNLHGTGRIDRYGGWGPVFVNTVSDESSSGDPL